MIFSSIFFIFVFLPIFLVLYYFVPRKLKNPVLFIGSLIFYAWGEPVYILLMLFSTVFNYYMGLELERLGNAHSRQKWNLVFTVAVNIAILGFFKYSGFLLDTVGGIIHTALPHPNLALPVGISFYTFKNLSYILDIYFGKISPQHNFLTFSVYSTMFPHMAAGPIVRYADIENQLTKRSINILRLGQGADLFIKGLTKKILLADNLSVIYAGISAGSGEMSLLTAWIGIFTYTMQIYFDFSGYSDMAIGLGKMLGFDFAKNFDHPYMSGSVSEFWRRWHISLGSWFRDYIYIPLGGNRVSAAKHVRNILVVWALTGLWHGASWNFVIWGLYYGILLLIEKLLLKDILSRMPGWLANLYTMLLISIGWVFFSQTDFASMGHYLLSMIGIGAHGLLDGTALYYLRTGGILFVICILACRDGLYRSFSRLTRNRPAMAVIANIALLLLCTAYMVYNTYTPFLYLKF